MAVTLSGCSDALQSTEQHRLDAPRTVNGDPAKGRDLVAAVGCGVCHTIPGIPGATGIVGPPLTTFARRTYIAGIVPNEPTALSAWVSNAPSLLPQTAMPRLPISHDDATHIVAFLYTLQK
ncbi:c-type cytochrome [Bradyrhizobium sp. LHD-71]|uniref:c-type cytochrome n=1 Tax=Bradyrhizobium sp. LHD-71 TaxID=3072141 RepID=UPI00280D433B|nr:c-type cytochrome [Bradyrhizobium sp. LHD-71]MDQ8732167.1 cytochrome C [Bradyrhizobium sp. LHD-71]